MLNRLIERATTTGAALTIACAGTLLMPASPAFAQSEPGRQGGSVEVASGPTLAESFWQTARVGGEDEMLGLLQSVREAGTPQRGFGASVVLHLVDDKNRVVYVFLFSSDRVHLLRSSRKKCVNGKKVRRKAR
ncbi:MAG: hypothetical protein AAFP26_07310, partial [Planctomycetota bacterium]